MLVLFNKPYDVLCQFTDQEGRKTLADFIPIKNIYAAGRLDRDSEGLLLLTDHGKLQDFIASPRYELKKTYWAQIDGEIDDQAINLLRNGVSLKDGITAPAEVRRMDEPDIWPRDPPIRERKFIPTCWIEISISEGRNRQVRRMTAAAGYPPLRLIRVATGPWSLGDLLPGHYLELSDEQVVNTLSKLPNVHKPQQLLEKTQWENRQNRRRPTAKRSRRSH